MHRPLEPAEFAATTPEGAGGIPRFRDGALFCLIVFLAVRILLSAVAVVGVRDAYPAGGVAGAGGQGTEEPATSGLHNAVDGTVRWDAYWYLAIAKNGYETSGRDAAFFPAYPLITRAVAEVSPFGAVGSALLVSNIAFLGALVAFHALTRREYSDELARRAVVFLAVFPTAFFFFAPYSESLFLLFTLLTFWWSRQDRWSLAAVAAAGAILTRAAGVLLVPCLLLDAFDPRTRETGLLQRVSASLAPLLALTAYGIWWFERNGDLLTPLHAQDSWMRSLTFPILTLVNATRLGVEGVGDPRGIYWTGDIVLTLCIIIPLVVGWRRLAPPFLAYAALSTLLPLTYPLPARPLLSAPRFVVVIFPAFWAISLLLRGRIQMRVALAASIVGFVVASLAFMNWGYLF
jgi:hypothetical protein